MVALRISMALIFLGFVVVALQPDIARSQGAGGSITGYAWSDTVGWVSLSGANYELSVDDMGVISGYAWSDNIGWISANSGDLADCPQAPCTASVASGIFSGWLKALSGSAESGWDGWISLSGLSPDYGVSQSGSSLSGYAWGSTVVGWLDFSYASTSYQACVLTQGYFCDGSTSKHRDSQCVVTINESCSYLCSPDIGLCVPPPAPAYVPGGDLRAEPRLVSKEKTVKVSWEIEHADSCTVTESNPDINDSWSGVASQSATCTSFGNGCRSGAISQMTTYTLACTGAGGDFTDSVTIALNPSWNER